ncbi:hypothetical protein GCM10010524_55720 [Streptomyces mexicanus]
MHFGACDRQAWRPHGAVLDDVAIAEVQAEKVGVCQTVQLAIASRARWTLDAPGALAAPRSVHVLPVADRSLRYVELACYIRVTGAVTEKREGLLPHMCAVEVHANTLRDMLNDTQ